jgi:hypothetical protein
MCVAFSGGRSGDPSAIHQTPEDTMSEAKHTEQQPAAQASDDEISEEGLEAVSGGLSLYTGGPGITLPQKPVIKPIHDPGVSEPTIIRPEG